MSKNRFSSFLALTSLDDRIVPANIIADYTGSDGAQYVVFDDNTITVNGAPVAEDFGTDANLPAPPANGPTTPPVLNPVRPTPAPAPPAPPVYGPNGRPEGERGVTVLEGEELHRLRTLKENLEGQETALTTQIASYRRELVEIDLTIDRLAREIKTLSDSIAVLRRSGRDDLANGLQAELNKKTANRDALIVRRNQLITLINKGEDELHMLRYKIQEVRHAIESIMNNVRNNGVPNAVLPAPHVHDVSLIGGEPRERVLGPAAVLVPVPVPIPAPNN